MYSVFTFFSCSLRLPRHRCPIGVISLSFVATHTHVRHYTNALYRIPPQQTIPTHSPSGEAIDTELFIHQVKELFATLKQTQLVENIYEMKSCPYYECLFSTELLFQHHGTLLPMPKYGRENRSAEMSETVRHMRACGASAGLNHSLQDVKGGRASGEDFVSTSHGVLMGYGNSRTNRLCMQALADSSDAQQQVQPDRFHPVELKEESPPLASMIAYAGMRTLLVSDTVHGRDAAEQAARLIQEVPWQVLRLEPDCSFLSHQCGVHYVYDVLCDQDFPDSMERIGECGLNPFPVWWSEPRKLGISMRSVCLITRFARGSMSGGGFVDSSSHRNSETKYHSRNAAQNPRLFQSGRRVYGDQGSPLYAQLRAGQLIPAAYQSPPRYAPPMHRSQSPPPLVPQDAP